MLFKKIKNCPLPCFNFEVCITYFGVSNSSFIWAWFFSSNFWIQVHNFTQIHKNLKSLEKVPTKKPTYIYIYIYIPCTYCWTLSTNLFLVWNFAPLQKELIVLSHVQCFKKNNSPKLNFLLKFFENRYIYIHGSNS